MDSPPTVGQSDNKIFNEVFAQTSWKDVVQACS